MSYHPNDISIMVSIDYFCHPSVGKAACTPAALKNWISEKVLLINVQMKLDVEPEYRSTSNYYKQERVNVFQP